MASAMISRIINKSHNRINIKQTQNGGNNIIQSQSIHINQNMNITGDGNYVTGIHVGVDGDIIDDFNKITINHLAIITEFIKLPNFPE